MASKKKLKNELRNMYEELSHATRSRDQWRIAAEAQKQETAKWRKKYELSLFSPEVKADTEAAFTRGADFAKRQALQAVSHMLDNLPLKEDKDANV